MLPKWANNAAIIAVFCNVFAYINMAEKLNSYVLIQKLNLMSWICEFVLYANFAIVRDYRICFWIIEKCYVGIWEI